MPASWEEIFLDFSLRKLSQLEGRIQDCLMRLSQEQIWRRGGESQNAVGNLVLHLCGNLRQWIGHGVGRLPDIRVREEEFAARGGLSRAELSARLAEAVAGASAVLKGLTAERLLELTVIQGYRVTVLEAVYHVVEHFSQHTGQIIFAARLFTGHDPGYYRHLSQAAPASDPTP
jgi:uncharacterized damage-inducible protein DinB